MKACSVSLNGIDCEVVCNTVCFSCGQPACRADSFVAAIYYRWRRKRVCRDCYSDRRADVKRGQISAWLDDYADDAISRAFVKLY